MGTRIHKFRKINEVYPEVYPEVPRERSFEKSGHYFYSIRRFPLRISGA